MSLDCAPAAASPQGLVEGERQAAAYLARLHASQAELALILAGLYGATLRKVGALLRLIGGAA